MPAYSFLDVLGAISGPGGSFSLSGGVGVAEEGISISMGSPKNVMQTGADGRGQHSLHASNAGTMTLRLQKTSIVNSQLSAMYHFQRLSSANWGLNQLTVTSIGTNDRITGSFAAFQKFPDLTFATDAGNIEWVFDVVSVMGILGFRI